MVLPIHRAVRRPTPAMPRNSIGMPTPALCNSATTSAPPTMNAALSTLTAATARARRSGRAQAWIAAKDGTIIKPPATARTPRAAAACQAIGRAKKADGAKAVVRSVAGRRSNARPRSSAQRPISSAPIAVGNRIMRPAESQAARPEPTPIATAKTARKIVTTGSAPPSVCMTRDGSSDSRTAPTSQKMLVTTAQRHSRVSAHNSPSNLPVERRRLGSIARSGAARAVFGMNRLAPQHRTANSIIVTASTMGSPPSFIATPPAIVPPRIAKKVAPSISALPAGSSPRCK